MLLLLCLDDNFSSLCVLNKCLHYAQFIYLAVDSNTAVWERICLSECRKSATMKWSLWALIMWSPVGIERNDLIGSETSASLSSSEKSLNDLKTISIFFQCNFSTFFSFPTLVHKNSTCTLSAAALRSQYFLCLFHVTSCRTFHSTFRRRRWCRFVGESSELFYSGSFCAFKSLWMQKVCCVKKFSVKAPEKKTSRVS